MDKYIRNITLRAAKKPIPFVNASFINKQPTGDKID
jgi:hypothetical protein